MPNNLRVSFVLLLCQTFLPVCNSDISAQIFARFSLDTNFLAKHGSLGHFPDHKITSVVLQRCSVASYPLTAPHPHRMRHAANSVYLFHQGVLAARRREKKTYSRT